MRSNRALMGSVLKSNSTKQKKKMKVIEDMILRKESVAGDSDIFANVFGGAIYR